jgi:membrane protease YdiL (CAAX protease family)
MAVKRAGTVDPGSRSAASLAWIVLIAAVVVVFVLQQFRLQAKAPSSPATPAAQTEPLVGTFDAPLMMGKLMVKLAEFLPAGERPRLLKDSGLEPGSLPLADAVAIVPILADLAGPEAAMTAIGTIERRLGQRAAKDPELARTLLPDVEVLRALYQGRAAGFAPSQLTPEQLERLRTRFGWTGELALTRGLPSTDPARGKLVGGGWQIIGLVVALIVVIALGLLVGLPLLVVGASMLISGRLRPRLDKMAPGGSVGVEVAAVFVACFLLLKLITGAVGLFILDGKTGPALAQAENNLQLISFGLQWLILPVVVLWPRLRGLDGAGSRRALGLHKGKGLLREVAAGVVGYVACLPLLFAGAIIAAVLLIISQGISAAQGAEPASGPINPLLEYFGAGTFTVVMLGALAVIWAPLVEEIVFRGGLLRQLRGPLPIIVASSLTAIVFAGMHGYSLLIMPTLIGLAIGFGLLRYWRGSLIACIVAHALHNALVACILSLLVSVVG